MALFDAMLSSSSMPVTVVASAPFIEAKVVRPVIVSVPADIVTTWSTASTTLVPSQNNNIVLPLGMAIPVPLDVFSVAA